MSVTIYWACNENEWLRAKEPKPVYKNFLKNKKDLNTEIQMCPSVKEYMDNTFYLQSLYDYNFEISKIDSQISSNLYDQDFFNDHVIIRSYQDKLFSFKQRFVFFTEEKSLQMSAGVLPFFENNNITQKCITIPGIIDVGKWFRQLDFAFYLKNNFNNFCIEENEIFQYIKFYTKEKIKFKQFKINGQLNKYLIDIEKSKDSRKVKNRLLENYYQMFKHKKYIIKEIKNNLI